MDLLIKMYLRVEPSDDMNEFMKQHAEALWVEKRKQDSMAVAIAKAFSGNK